MDNHACIHLRVKARGALEIKKILCTDITGHLHVHTTQYHAYGSLKTWCMRWKSSNHTLPCRHETPLSHGAPFRQQCPYLEHWYLLHARRLLRWLAGSLNYDTLHRPVLSQWSDTSTHKSSPCSIACDELFRISTVGCSFFWRIGKEPSSRQNQ
jgi:hypothetical protein